MDGKPLPLGVAVIRDPEHYHGYRGLAQLERADELDVRKGVMEMADPSIAVAIPKKLVKALFNADRGKWKELYCPSCRTFTRCLTVSWAHGDRGMMELAGRLCDWNPFNQLLGKPVVCRRCERFFTY